MLSLQQAIEIKESIVSYLKATFTFRKREVAKAFDDFIYHPTQGMFKGPYLSLKLRFEKANQEAVAKIPLDIKPAWAPYDHQVKAWEKLSTQNKEPEPTIVTTGTGSGKTEAFLYPILDYCYQQRNRPGIKVVIMYPMNALATDQAKRLAEMIYEDERLRGQIIAGLFIGEGQGEKGTYPRQMGEEHIIEDRNSIVDSPPDILLTNFKMLDYALMKHQYHNLWSHNFNDNSLFRFLVLDELHTYDGAQGTDVANLIRRLKLKLKMPKGQLCPVGTSATIGSGEEAPKLLAEYATKVFGEKILPEAIITEKRVNLKEFFGPKETLLKTIPDTDQLKDLVYHEREDFDVYVQSHIDIWQLDKDNLAKGLLQFAVVKDLIKIFQKGKALRTVNEVLRELSMNNDSFRSLPQRDEEYDYSPKERVLESLLTLIAFAKDIDDPRLPFMYLQVQLWIRELSGIQYTLEQPAQFSFRDQVDAQKELAALPPWYCRECNASGWLGAKLENGNSFSKDINSVYNKYFNHDKNVYFILPKDELSEEDFKATGYYPDDFLKENIDPISLRIIGEDEEGFEIQALRKIEDNKTEHICPCCNSINTVAIIGTKIPTLSSIAVSQTLATDLDSAEDKDRKVLAFTNSVQDAAHQAGFIESRNYRFTFRASIQKVINQQHEPIRLTELAERFMEFWKEHADKTGSDSLSGYLYRFYPKDYIGKSSPEDYKTVGGYNMDFLKEFDHRMRWEVYSEFGFTSLIGRTLEKTGASSVYFDPDALQRVWKQMEEWIQTNDVSGQIAEKKFIQLTNMILHRTRNRGGIDHLFLRKFREENLKLWDLNWMKDNRHFLNPKYHKNSRFPKLLTNQSSRKGLLDTTTTRTSNWFHSYFIKTFPLASVTTEFINEFYNNWLEAMLQVGLLSKANSGDFINYSIVPEAIWVKRDVNVYSCNHCENTVYTNDDEELLADSACMTYRCPGKYYKEAHVVRNYYKAVYNRNRFPRVYASEHTGLLDRQVREELESDFKQRKQFNSTNALVATSTLEMGIDIGSLNTAYNNSTPPLPSNFLQRVGRAGRSSGSALIVNFAKNQNHDLYYYADPLEMMDGDINTPGCYLEAKDILKRHFTAYCIDSWTSANPIENTIPTFIRDLKLRTRKLSESNFFINRLNNYIQNNTRQLVEDFLKQYNALVAEQAFVGIQQNLDTGEFYHNLFEVFNKIKDEFHSIDERWESIDNEIKTLNVAKGDPIIEEYNREKRSLSGIRKSINARLILEHLTNVGILPNYAFPETGVKLNAQVLGSVVEGSSRPRDDKSFELIRPASQAIRELAPENYFYTQGYRFEISGINTFDWSEHSNYHLKRFCSKCDHLEEEKNLKNKRRACPKCGDPSWSSSSNVHRFAKLTNVKSFNSTTKATLSDSNDDRDRQNYNLVHHININPESSEGAWVLKEIPFGIEFVRNVKIISVNYGRQDSNDARKIKINDQEVPTKGFVTCKNCGKSISATHLYTEAKDFHYGYCKHRDKKYEPNNTEVFEELYLFREMQTELLKIILPVQEFNTEEDIRMFQAGLELGLKKYFKGNPGHIRIQSYREFNQNTDKFDRFLLLYDTIPGGTGYLEELFDDNNFSELLKNSYEAIRDCSCQLDGHDGCYKCIYSYGNQHQREGLSRERAESWFSKIYENTEGWERNQLGLTSITNSGRIEESELEERFIKLLKQYSEKEDAVTFIEDKQHGVVRYLFTIEKGDITANYTIRPQVVLGPKDGIEFSTRTDFLINCHGYIYKGENYMEKVPKIAVYLDGYQYHASKEHNVFERDVNIRKAIVKHSDYKTWTLTWNDLDLFEAQLNDTIITQDEIAKEYQNKFLNNFKDRLFPNAFNSDSSNLRVNYATGLNNMHRLQLQLLWPVIPILELSWYTYLISWTKELIKPSFSPDSLAELLSKERTIDNYIQINKITDFDALFPVEVQVAENLAEWNIWVNRKRKEVFHQLSLTDISAIDKDEWQYFWTLFNLFQSDRFIDEDEFIYASEAVEELDLMEELKEVYEEEMYDLLQSAIDKQYITQANLDYLDSLLDTNGHVLADAELVLEKAKIAIDPFSDESKQVFEKQGFKVYTMNQINEIVL